VISFTCTDVEEVQPERKTVPPARRPLVCIHICTYVHTPTHAHTHTYLFVNIYIYLHLYVCIHIYTYISIYIYICTYMCMCVDVYACMYIYTYINRYVCNHCTSHVKQPRGWQWAHEYIHEYIIAARVEYLSRMCWVSTLCMCVCRLHK